jgi:predicted NBD/HSP70 family sugar kinase
MNTDSSLNSSAAAIGIDLGGTKTEAIILNPDGTVLWRQRR